MGIMKARNRRSGYYLFDSAAKRRGDNAMIKFESKTWTWRQMQKSAFSFRFVLTIQTLIAWRTTGKNRA